MSFWQPLIVWGSLLTVFFSRLHEKNDLYNRAGSGVVIKVRQIEEKPIEMEENIFSFVSS